MIDEQVIVIDEQLIMIEKLGMSENVCFEHFVTLGIAARSAETTTGLITGRSAGASGRERRGTW